MTRLILLLGATAIVSGVLAVGGFVGTTVELVAGIAFLVASVILLLIFASWAVHRLG